MRFLIHCTAWILFMTYELATIFFLDGTVKGLAATLPYYILYISLFYVHAEVVLPYVFSGPRPYVRGILSVVAEIVMALLIKYVLDLAKGYRLDYHSRIQLTRYLFLATWRDLYFMAFGTAYWMVRSLFRYRDRIAETEKLQLVALKEKAEVERDLAEARYAFLQQQASPHFLFNTLNFVYNSVYHVSPAASKMLLHLADLMRYSLHEGDEPALLTDELEQVRNLIEMNRLRYGQEVYLEYNENGKSAGLSIIPLVLLTFTENVFKHGNLREPLHPGKIEIVVKEGGLLEMRTWNRKKRQPAQRRVKSVGIENARRRLDHAYGGRYTLKMGGDNESFELKLTIQL